MKYFLKCSIFLLAASLPTAALSFDASPNPNGTFDLRIDHSWGWGAGFFTGFDAALLNPLSVDSGSGYYVATSGTSIEASGDVLGYTTKGPMKVGIAANVLYNPSWLKEVGYIDLSSGGRLFLVNERDILLILPRIKAALSGNLGPLSVSVDGEYAPWFPVTLKQTLETSTTGPLAVAEHSSKGTGSNAWSVSGSAILRNSILSPEVEFSYDNVPISYSYLDASTAVNNLDALILDTSLLGGFTLDALKLGGSALRVLAGYEWSTTKDRASGETVVSDRRFRIKVGLGL
jgi:hypothetical protein